jgi:hypothetical protein
MVSSRMRSISAVVAFLIESILISQKLKIKRQKSKYKTLLNKMCHTLEVQHILLFISY